MAKQLVVLAGPDKGRVFPIPAADPLLVGRSKTTATCLNDPHVSRIHCQVQLVEGKAILTDSGSAAGTFVNGKRAEEQPLLHGDAVGMGDTQLRYEDTEASEGATLPPATPAAPPAKAAAAPAAERLTDLVGKTLSYFEVQSVVAKGQSGVVFQAK